MLAKADFAIVLFLFIFFGFSTVMLSLLLSSFFSKARAAALICPVIFFVLSIPAFALSQEAPASTLAALGIFSPTAFSLGLRLLFNYENIQGLKGADIASKTDDVNMASTYALLVFDIVFYLLLALYFDYTLPSEWGTREPWLLCLSKPLKKLCCFCCGKSDAQLAEEDERDNAASPKNRFGVKDGRLKGGHFQDVESAADIESSAVQLRGLRKDFVLADGSTLRAVNDMTFNIKEGEVLALLGHNGSGKSTTMNMITGMIPTDSGDAIIYGKSVNEQLDEIRQNIGYCPQHNILWPELTCMEHLRFFAAIKGVTGDEAENACLHMLERVDLYPKRHAAAGSLSGGQKRKLSVAIAFIGNPQFVLLDECTAGMDVGARRHIWNLIRDLSKGRVILLSTHFMDEADILGDNIAIMSHGRLYCLGSRTYLKTHLGVGYTLTMALRANDESGKTDRHALAQLVKNHIEDSYVLDSAPGEMIIKLPTQDTSKFPDLLRDVEAHSEKYGATGFGINATTLEEVFVKIDERYADQVAEQKMLDEQTKNLIVNGTNAGNSEASPAGTEMTTTTKTTAEVAMNQHSHTKKKDAFETSEENQKPLFEHDEKARVAVSFFDQVSVLWMKRFNYARRDTKGLIIQILVPVIALLVAIGIASVKFPDQPSIKLGSDIYGRTDTVISDCFDSATFLAGSPDFAAYKMSSVNTIETPMQFNYPNNTAGLNNYLAASTKGHKGDRVGAFSCNATSALTYPIPVLFTNESFPHAAAFTNAVFYDMYLRSLAGGGTAAGVANAPKIEAYMFPLPFTLRTEAIINSFAALLLGIFVMVPFAIVPSVFVSFVVKERENQSKYLQLVMGLDIWPYWVTNLVFDVIAFFFTNLLAIFVFLIFDRKEYIGNGTNFGAIFLLFTIYSFSGTAFAYFLSFFFDSHTVAQNLVMLINFVFGFLVVILIFVLEFLESTKDAAKVLKWIFRIIPPYALGDGIVAVAVAEQTRTFNPATGNSLTVDISGYDMIYMTCTFFLWFGLTLWLDKPGSRGRYYLQQFSKCLCFFCNLCGDDHKEAEEEQTVVVTKKNINKNNNNATTTQQQQQQTHEEFSNPRDSDQDAAVTNGGGYGERQSSARKFESKEDPDVVEEAQRVLKLDGSDKNNKQNDIIIVQNLRKVWEAASGDVVAVNKISFGVKKGEVFGFLGTNGAGKTTAISILSGVTNPTGGQAFISGYNVETETESVRRIIGLCPQFDALTDLLTVEEHFKLYCGLRGVPPATAGQVTEKLIDMADLEEHRFKTAESLSGGNKRKLSFALALIGAPDVVFLDEVSAGIDPVARHKLWSLIERVAKDCSVILTTHHLEEIEALAHRCAIMVAGSLKCIGSLQHLKNKFGTGFEVQIRVKHEDEVERCENALIQKFADFEWNEVRGTKMAGTFTQSTKLSDVFEFLGNHKEELSIEDYTVSQSSIEQVFLRIAAEALERQGDF